MSSAIGFIGIGNMGFMMASNVRKKMEASATLYIYDVNRTACETFKENLSEYGAVEVTASCRDIAQKCAIVLSMVPMDDHARSVYLDSTNGIIAADQSTDRLLLDCSTIAVSTSKDIGELIAAAGTGVFVDTPVSGGVNGAMSGTLSFFCGHDAKGPLAERIEATVSWMGHPDRINFCGTTGSGLTSKLVNNYIGLSNMVTAAEGLAMGIRLGVDKKVLWNSLKGSSGDSWVLEYALPVPGVLPNSASSNGFKAGFTPPLCVKDIQLGVNAAHQVGIEPSMGNQALKVFRKAAEDDATARLDCSAVWLHINDEVDYFRLNGQTFSDCLS